MRNVRPGSCCPAWTGWIPTARSSCPSRRCLDVMRHAWAEERHRVPVGLLYRAGTRDSPCSSQRGPLPGRWAEGAADSPDGPESASSASQRRLAAFGRDSQTEAGHRRALGAHSDGPTAVVDDHRYRSSSLNSSMHRRRLWRPLGGQPFGWNDSRPLITPSLRRGDACSRATRHHVGGRRVECPGAEGDQ